MTSGTQVEPLAFETFVDQVIFFAWDVLHIMVHPTDQRINVSTMTHHHPVTTVYCTYSDALCADLYPDLVRDASCAW